MHDQLINLLLTGTIDTLIMVGISALAVFFNWFTDCNYPGQYQ